MFTYVRVRVNAVRACETSQQGVYERRGFTAALTDRFCLKNAKRLQTAFLCSRSRCLRFCSMRAALARRNAALRLYVVVEGFLNAFDYFGLPTLKLRSSVNVTANIESALAIAAG